MDNPIYLTHIDTKIKILWTLNNSPIFNKMPNCLKKYFVNFNNQQIYTFNDHKNILIIGQGNSGKTTLINDLLAKIRKSNDITYNCLMHVVPEGDCEVTAEMLVNRDYTDINYQPYSVLLVIDESDNICNHENLVKLMNNNKYYNTTVIIVTTNYNAHSKLNIVPFNCVITFGSKYPIHENALGGFFGHGPKRDQFNNEFNKLKQYQVLINDDRYDHLIKYKANKQIILIKQTTIMF